MYYLKKYLAILKFEENNFFFLKIEGKKIINKTSFSWLYTKN